MPTRNDFDWFSDHVFEWVIPWNHGIRLLKINIAALIIRKETTKSCILFKMVNVFTKHLNSFRKLAFCHSNITGHVKQFSINTNTLMARLDSNITIFFHPHA